LGEGRPRRSGDETAPAATAAGTWTAEEDDVIRQRVALGVGWADIAALLLPKRTPAAAQHRWYSYLRTAGGPTSAAAAGAGAGAGAWVGAGAGAWAMGGELHGVGRCRLPVSKPVLKVESAYGISALTYNMMKCFETLLSSSTCAATTGWARCSR